MKSLWKGLILAIASGCSSLNFQPHGLKTISLKEYNQRVYDSWIGQMVGNIYGLPHENIYIESPGQENFPYGYGKNLALLNEYQGGFSDDDTDIEYIYLLAMEKNGINPKYKNIVDLWKYHVRDKVWLGNRAALGNMHYDLGPPFSGSKEKNPHWFQIDPQLVNEIWAVTAPGMKDYAIEKSIWSASITSSDWGIGPTIFYAAMFSEAFFEKDHLKLIQAGLDALPPQNRFKITVADMMDLYKKYPHDWKTARKEAKRKYYDKEPIETKSIWNANLNGAMAVLALLYGQGDFQKTLDFSCALGFDADNQAATLSGLIALSKGKDVIPKNLLFPFPSLDWQKPFNDHYKNITRYALPDSKITELTNRIAQMGEKVVLENGGKKILRDGEYFLQIPTQAKFTPSLEFPNPPPIKTAKGVFFEKELLVIGGQPPLKWDLSGKLPKGLSFDQNGKIFGTPKEEVISEVTFSVMDSLGNKDSKTLEIVVVGPNLAFKAKNILSNVKTTSQKFREQINLTIPSSYYSDDIESIRDGKTFGPKTGFYSIGASVAPKKDYFGYRFESSQKIGLISFTFGPMEESSGWVTGVNVEYLDEKGKWKPVKNLVIFPKINFENSPFNKAPYAQHFFFFDPVETTQIKVGTTPGGVESWDKRKAYFTSLSELEVYAPVKKWKEFLYPVM